MTPGEIGWLRGRLLLCPSCDVEQMETLLVEAADAIDSLRAKIAELEGERDASEKHRNDLYDKVQAQLTEIGALRGERDAASARVRSLEEALTPSAHTKAAYIGEFHMGITLRHRGQEDYRSVPIEWTTIKEIMAAISARAVGALHQNPESKA